MKVLLCERNSFGHRKIYMKCISQVSDIVFYSFAPFNVGFDSNRFFEYNMKSNNKSLGSYIKWICSIKKIVNDNKIDVVHILDGDSILRFFGIGLYNIGSKKIIITYHHFFDTLIKKISYVLINRYDFIRCVVHTENIKKRMNKMNVDNIYVCEYPAFNYNDISKMNTNECKEEFGIDKRIPVIGIVGGMNKYKNILSFLNILRECKMDFQLLICGKPSDITEAEIDEAISTYKEKVIKKIYELSNDEYLRAIVASDIIFSLYSVEFNGASGPMVDGVCAKKMILASDHGSLGCVVRENYLGLVADVRNKKDVIKQTELAILHAFDFQYNKYAEEYRSKINPINFLVTYKKIYYS